MIRRALYGATPIPNLVLIIALTFLVAGLAWWRLWLMEAIVVIGGSACTMFGYRRGRNSVLDQWQHERDEAATHILPEILSDIGEEMPEEVREMLQGELREAHERLAHE